MPNAPYAPRDSKSCPVEHVIAALKEAVPDGSSSNPKSIHSLRHSQIFWRWTHTEEIEEAELRFKHEEVLKCASQVATRYEGKKCIGTRIHGDVLMYQTYEDFSIVFIAMLITC